MKTSGTGAPPVTIIGIVTPAAPASLANTTLICLVSPSRTGAGCSKSTELSVTVIVVVGCVVPTVTPLTTVPSPKAIVTASFGNGVLKL